MRCFSLRLQAFALRQLRPWQDTRGVLSGVAVFATNSTMLVDDQCDDFVESQRQSQLYDRLWFVSQQLKWF